MRLTKRVGGTTPHENNKLNDQSTLIMWLLIALGGICFISVVFSVLKQGVF